MIIPNSKTKLNLKSPSRIKENTHSNKTQEYYSLSKTHDSSHSMFFFKHQNKRKWKVINIIKYGVHILPFSKYTYCTPHSHFKVKELKVINHLNKYSHSNSRTRRSSRPKLNFWSSFPKLKRNPQTEESLTQSESVAASRPLVCCRFAAVYRTRRIPNSLGCNAAGSDSLKSSIFYSVLFWLPDY